MDTRPVTIKTRIAGPQALWPVGSLEDVPSVGALLVCFRVRLRTVRFKLLPAGVVDVVGAWVLELASSLFRLLLSVPFFVATRLLEVRMLLGLLGGSGCWCAWSPPVVRVGSICCPVGVYWVRC